MNIYKDLGLLNVMSPQEEVGKGAMNQTYVIFSVMKHVEVITDVVFTEQLNNRYFFQSQSYK